MNLKLRKIYITVNLWRVIPVCCFMKLSKFRDKIKEDLDVWKREDGNLEGKIYSTGEILLYDKAFINLLLNRLHRDPLLWVITRIFFSPRDSLEINMPPEKIGGGMYFQHGFATVIAAKEIGEHCWINQQVTVGYTNKTDAPIIGNNCKISAGAIVVGDVCVGDNAVVGAGAVVTKNVKANSVVVGCPARELNNKKN